MRINSGMVILRPSPKVLIPRYLQVVLKSFGFGEQVSVLLSGSAQSQLPINKLSRISFSLPPVEEQHAIAAQVERLQSQVDSIKRLQAGAAAKLTALMPSILSKAFRGEL